MRHLYLHHSSIAAAITAERRPAVTDIPDVKAPAAAGITYSSMITRCNALKSGELWTGSRPVDHKSNVVHRVGQYFMDGGRTETQSAFRIGGGGQNKGSR